MLHRKIILYGILLCSFLSFGQEPTTKKDSTDAVYQSIEAYSKKGRFTKFMHKLIFKSVEIKPADPKYIRRKEVKRHADFESKIIRNIEVTTLDPFGYSEKDTSAGPKRFLSKVGNSVHIKTRNLTIKNLLLIKRNKPLDTLLMQESERLIRSQRYVRRVIIEPRLVSKGSDSVDVYVRVLDSWSLIPNLTPTTSRVTYELTERNFMGTGHEWDNTFRQNLDDKKNAYSTRYTIPNIRNTYIRTSVNYQVDLDNDYLKGITIERPFFSPYARWAGGIQLERKFQSDSMPDLSNNYALQTFRNNTFDVWGGHSIPVSKGTSELKRTTNLVTTLRLLYLNYSETPETAYDTLRYFSDERLILSGIGISSRRFVQDSYVFNYNITEDVPIGSYYGITGGYQNKNSSNRLYLGVRATLGNYLKWGYLSTNYEFGSFYKNNRTEQNAFAAQLNYFTPLIEIGQWKLRQFIRNEIIIGNRRLATVGDQLSINEDNGIQGFNSPKFSGTKKLLLSVQTQSYSPWEWAGFRFSPFFNYTMGMLGTNRSGFKKSKAYSKVGLGVIITNDYLVFNSFQLSFSYYPTIPFEGDNIIKTNTFRSTDFGYLDFEINKPRTVLYQ